MVIYTNEKDLTWYQLLDRGLEVALVAHADPGHNHGECVGLSRAFDLAKKFNAIPVDHILSYELMMRYPEQFKPIMETAGSNHTWLTTTLCIYTGEGKKDIRPKRDRYNQLLEFGFIEETCEGMNKIVTAGSKPNQYRAPSQLSRNFKEAPQDELDSFLYTQVPRKQENKFNIVEYPNYKLNRQGSKVLVEVDWDNVKEISKNQLESFGHDLKIKNSLLLPNFLQDGFSETQTYFSNPTLGFFAPAESYRKQRHPSYAKEYNPNYWRFSTRGEAVIIQRPL